jgi:hypothetical protein
MSTTDSLSNPTGTVSVSSPPQRTWSDWFSGHVETAKKAVGVTPVTDSNSAANMLGTSRCDTMLGGAHRKRRNVTRNKKMGGGRKKTRGRR